MNNILSDRVILLTGGSGFIGHHAFEHFARKSNATIIILDGLNYAAALSRLTDIECWDVMRKMNRVKVLYHDIRSPFSDRLLTELASVTDVIHLAAETHVERSLKDAEPFVETNVRGTLNVLEFARRQHQKGVLKKYIQISTDEVYGPARKGQYFKENAPIKPSNPYAATKAASDALAYSFYISHGLPVYITRTMNNFGERQHTEKLIPTVMRSILAGKKIPIYGTKRGLAYRHWLHARNHADALLFLLSIDYKFGETFHIVGEEYSNLDIAKMISEEMGAPFEYDLIPFYQARPGHDKRYALNGKKLQGLGWKPPMTVGETIHTVVNWTMQPSNQSWLQLA